MSVPRATIAHFVTECPSRLRLHQTIVLYWNPFVHRARLLCFISKISIKRIGEISGPECSFPGWNFYKLLIAFSQAMPFSLKEISSHP